MCADLSVAARKTGRSGSKQDEEASQAGTVCLNLIVESSFARKLLNLNPGMFVGWIVLTRAGVREAAGRM